MSELDDAVEVIGNLAVALEKGPEELAREDVEIVPVPSEYQEPWDRREDESNSHYAQFLHFRDQGLGRTVAATHRHFNGEMKRSPTKRYPDGMPQGIRYVTSQKFEWKARAAQWDQDQERQYQLARSEAVREMVDRHEDEIVEAIEALMTPIRVVNRLIETDDEFVNSLSKSDAKKLISMANQAARTIPSLMNAERLARGMPTEIVGGTVDHKHVVAVERDQIGEILEVLGTAGVLDVGGGNLGTGEIIDAEVVDVHPIPAEGDDELADPGHLT